MNNLVEQFLCEHQHVVCNELVLRLAQHEVATVHDEATHRALA